MNNLALSPEDIEFIKQAMAEKILRVGNPRETIEIFVRFDRHVEESQRAADKLAAELESWNR